MMIKKKLVAFLLSALMVLSLAGCGNGGASASVMEVSGIAIPEGVFNYYFEYGKANLANYGIDVEAEGNEQFLSVIEEQTVEIMKEAATIRLAAEKLGIETDKKAVQEQLDSFKQSLEQTVTQEQAALTQLEDQLKQLEEKEAQEPENKEAENGDNATGDADTANNGDTPADQPADNASGQEEAKDDKAKLEEQIKELKANIKKDPYKRFLEEYNMSAGDMEWIVETMVLSDAVQKELTKDIVVSDEDAQAAYEANKDAYDTMNFSHILINVADNASEADWAAAESKAKDLINQLNNGADFATLAKENSADGSAQDGGKLNKDVTKAESPYVPEFTEAAFQLENIGDYTKTPVKTQFGYHIIKVDSMKKGFDALKDAVKESMSQTKQQEAVNAYYEELKQGLEITKDYERKYGAKEEEDGGTEGQNDANAGGDAANDENTPDSGNQDQPQGE